MKFKFTALVIVAITFCVIGALVFWANADFPTPVSFTTNSNTNQSKQEPTTTRPKSEDSDQPASFSLEERESAEQFSQQDVVTIQNLAQISDTDLLKEWDELKTKITEEHLFDRLELGDLSDVQAQSAKQILERFALLGLERTRRSYQEIEPQLKDPIYAHRDSLKEIRRLLDEH